METIGIHASVIRAGKANMFLSPLFRETLAGVSGATTELYDTDGSIGAARGAGIGSGYYASAKEAFATLQKLDTIAPDITQKSAYDEAYHTWKSLLNKHL
jgi:xylulokinase